MTSEVSSTPECSLRYGTGYGEVKVYNPKLRARSSQRDSTRLATSSTGCVTMC